MPNFKPQRVFLTGASSGIGAALARAYAAQGVQLALVARRADVLQQLADSLPVSAHGAHRIYPLDVTNAKALSAAASDFIAACGVPDVVIANAGVSAGTLTEEAEDLAVFQRIFDTNVMATVATFQPFIVPMRSTGRPVRLVGIGSVAGIRGLPGSSAYCASKAAVLSYCESLRVELRDSAIRVVTIAPGYIATPMTAKNEFPMPFLMLAEQFAQRALASIAQGSSFRIIPWPMGWVAKLLRVLPNFVFDRAFAGVKRKARLTET